MRISLEGCEVAMSTQTNTRKGASANQIGKFLKGVRSELKKVIWPNRKELINNTIIVIISVILVTFSLWVLDSVFGFILNLIVG